MLDEELASLPEKLRVPLVLHFLEEKTQSEAISQSVIQLLRFFDRVLHSDRVGATGRSAPIFNKG